MKVLIIVVMFYPYYTIEYTINKRFIVSKVVHSSSYEKNIIDVLDKNNNVIYHYDHLNKLTDKSNFSSSQYGSWKIKRSLYKVEEISKSNKLGLEGKIYKFQYRVNQTTTENHPLDQINNYKIYSKVPILKKYFKDSSYLVFLDILVDREENIDEESLCLEEFSYDYNNNKYVRMEVVSINEATIDGNKIEDHFSIKLPK